LEKYFYIAIKGITQR